MSFCKSPADLARQPSWIDLSRRPLRTWIFIAAAAATACASQPATVRMFPDRPIAWAEHDDAPVAHAPAERGLEDEDHAILIRDFFTRESDRVLSFEAPTPAVDVNALDEVPCSTWFCPRNHVRPLSPADIAEGPSGTVPPRLPLTITAGKARGAATGFVAKDAAGRKFLIKLDPARHGGLGTGAEMVVSRLMHAAGYYVPGAQRIDLADADLRVGPDARMLLSGVVRRPFTRERLRDLLADVARTPAGRVRAVAVSWIPGKVIGAFDYYGTRPDDPNDRFAHEHRRALRATYLFFAWLNVEDASARNTLDSYVEVDGRHFVRHYLIDFGTSLGSSTTAPKSVYQGREHLISVSRTVGATLAGGAYQRAWQRDAVLWRKAEHDLPEVGWFYPVDEWHPEEFRTARKNPAHVRMTDRDAYWGAKIITSFTDAQIRAVVATAGYSPAASAYIERALRVRRDRIGQRYLLSYAAVESPSLTKDGSLCFEDLALARGYADPGAVTYSIELVSYRDNGTVTARRTITAHPRPKQTCVAIADQAGERPTYLIASVTTHVQNRASRPTHIHLRRRAHADGFVVAGIDRSDP